MLILISNIEVVIYDIDREWNFVDDLSYLINFMSIVVVLDVRDVFVEKMD